MFQKVMDSILQGTPGALCCIDNIMVTGATEEHLKKLGEVLCQLQLNDIQMKKSKCYFMRNVMEYTWDTA